MLKRPAQLIFGILFLVYSAFLVGRHGAVLLLGVGIVISFMEIVCAFSECMFCTVIINFAVQFLLLSYALHLVQINDIIPATYAGIALTISLVRNYLYAFNRRYCPTHISG